MLKISKILKALSSSYIHLKVKQSEDFDFNCGDYAYFIEKGSVLSIGEKKLTQLLKEGDPIGFAEIILAKKKFLNYRRASDLELIRFNGDILRKEVNKSHIVVKSIIKYSLARIYGQSMSRSHFLLEDEYIIKNRQFFRKLNFRKDDKIFIANQPARGMYYIEQGSVSLFTKNNRKLADLIKSESFGESSLITGQNRNNTAIANTQTSLVEISSENLLKQISIEKSIVQLVLYCVLKRLEIMNKLRLADDFSCN